VTIHVSRKVDLHGRDRLPDARRPAVADLVVMARRDILLWFLFAVAFVWVAIMAVIITL
jgi:hypothetical protein